MDALLQLRTGTDVAAFLTANPELRPVLEPMLELQAGDDVAEAGVPAPLSPGRVFSDYRIGCELGVLWNPDQTMRSVKIRCSWIGRTASELTVGRGSGRELWRGELNTIGRQGRGTVRVPPALTSRPT